MNTRLAAFLLSALLMPACTSLYLPGHGGGKRLHLEQELLSRTTEEALSTIAWDELPLAVDGDIQVNLMAVGDEGGSTQSSAFFGLFGGTSASEAGGVTMQAAPPAPMTAQVFSNARDLELLKGLILERIHASGARVATRDENVVGDLYVVVETFGTLRDGLNALIYSEASLEVAVRLRAFYVPRHGDYLALKRGDATGYFAKRYLFGAISLRDVPITIE